MMQLPFVLSIPHCGVELPIELRPELALNDREIVESVDFGTREIFAGLSARRVIAARWSRLVVDVNRSPTNYSAKGAVALRDYHGRPVFKPGKEPTNADIEARMIRYARPYHEEIAIALRDEEVIGLIDCHSLNGIGPADAPDCGQLREDITLSNNGNGQGQQRSNEEAITCPVQTLHMAVEAFNSQGFSVSLNHPYRGGYIVNHYGALLQSRGRFALQIEMNQDLYMERDAIIPDPERLRDITLRVEQALNQWHLQLLAKI
jgi:N-formylglutamate deformylase